MAVSGQGEVFRIACLSILAFGVFFFFDRLGWISTGYRAWDFRSGSDVRFGRFF